MVMTETSQRESYLHQTGFWSVKVETVDKTNVICKFCKRLLLFHFMTFSFRTRMQSSHLEEFSQECHDDGPALKLSRILHHEYHTGVTSCKTGRNHLETHSIISLLRVQ